MNDHGANNTLFKIVLLFIIDLESPCLLFYIILYVYVVDQSQPLVQIKVSESAQRFPFDFSLSWHTYAPLFISQSYVIGTKTRLAILFLAGILR